MNDLRFVLRMLARKPGFSFIVILTLAFGMAGNIIIFTVFNTFYLRPFPFNHPEQLVDLDESAPRWNLQYTGLSYPDFNAWREHNRTFQGMAAWGFGDYNYASQDNMERIRAAQVTHDLAAVLQIKPMLGRFFTAEEDRPGGSKAVILSHGFWKRQLGENKDAIGKSLKLNQDSYTIIGVLPPSQSLFVDAELWVPLAMDPNNMNRGWFLRGIARLKEGVSINSAQEDLLNVHRSRIEQKLANENTFPRLTTLSERFFGSTRSMIQLLLGAVSVVLLIACGNVAAMMLARGLSRYRELGLRMCLGASRKRLALLIGTENLMLASIGSLGGFMLGYWGLQVILHHFAETPPNWISFDMDWRIGLFAVSMTCIAALLGALPVLISASKIDMHAVIQSSAQQSSSSSGGLKNLRALVAIEMALTLVVMVLSMLLVQAFYAVQKADPGFKPDHVLVYEIDLPTSKYGSAEVRTEFFRNHLENIRTLPGVEAVSAVNAPPLGGHWGNFFTIENAPPKKQDEPDPVVLQRVAFPQYFETMHIPIMSGRSFSEHEEIPVVIVNETFAKRFWPGQSPVGKRMRHRGSDNPWMTVVGVAKDIKHYGLDQPMIPGVYIPFAQIGLNQMAIVVRTLAEPESLASAIRNQVRNSDPALPIFGISTMEGRLSRSIWVRRLCTSMFGMFSCVALFLAIGGIYGVFSYAVNRRTLEMGIRLALGAQRRDIMRMVLKQGLNTTTIGIAIGTVVAVIAASLLKSFLIGVNPLNPLVFAGIGALLALVALLASWLPARRAASVNPMEALRSE